MLNSLTRTNNFTGSSKMETKGFTETPKNAVNSVTYVTETGFVQERVSNESKHRAYYNSTIQKSHINGRYTS
jgi:hypothetical protein